MKIKKNTQSLHEKKCCKEKHLDLLFIGEGEKKHYVFIKDLMMYDV